MSNEPTVNLIRKIIRLKIDPTLMFIAIVALVEKKEVEA